MNIALIVSRYDAGHLQSGWGLGAQAIMESGLAAALMGDGHEVTVHDIGQVEGVQGREIATGFAVCRAIAGEVRAAVDQDRFPIVIAGNCMSAVGAVAGEDADGIVWFDQHGDLHLPETTTSGLIDGMALSTVLGWSWQSITAETIGLEPIDAENCLLVDARDLDDAESGIIIEQSIRHVTLDDAADAASGLGAERVHLHLDLDVHNPVHLRVNGYNHPGGPTPAELRRAAGDIAAILPVAGMTVTAYDPGIDRAGEVPGQVAELLRSVLASLSIRME